MAEALLVVVFVLVVLAPFGPGLLELWLQRDGAPLPLRPETDLPSEKPLPTPQAPQPVAEPAILLGISGD